jgi:hypothetical protein
MPLARSAQPPAPRGHTREGEPCERSEQCEMGVCAPQRCGRVCHRPPEMCGGQMGPRPRSYLACGCDGALAPVRIGEDDADVLHELLHQYLRGALRSPYLGTNTQHGALRWFTSFLVGRYVRNTAWASALGPTEIRVSSDLRLENTILKNLMVHYVFGAPSLVTQQFGQRRVIRELIDIYWRAVKDSREAKILPERYREHGCKSDADCKRLAADIVSSLTEDQAIAMHGRLSGRDPGHVRDGIIV